MTGDQNYLFARALDRFLVEITGLASSLPVIMQSLSEDRQRSIDEIEQFLEEINEGREEFSGDHQDDSNEHMVRYKISLEHVYDFSRRLRTVSKHSATVSVIPKSFLVGMVSQFDAFFGRLIRAMYISKPEMLNASNRPLTFAELIKFGSLDTARNYILEKEVETILRDSHSKHFEWLEAKLGIPLRKGLDIWSKFVELTERRNLFVHTDGEVSTQYIDVCTQNGVSIEDGCTVGSSLAVSPDYFQQSYEVLFELAAKLAHVMWRKLIPAELDSADRHVIDICYQLLKDEKYSLAENITSFALSLPRYHSQRTRYVHIVNLSIAYKWGGKPEKATKLITETDWSACSIDFKLTSEVLLGHFDEASNLMQRIGDRGEVGKADYQDWPVFNEFRHSPQFLNTYKEVFGQSVETIEVDQGSEVDTQDEYEKDLLIRDLASSSSFFQTHALIKLLRQHSGFSVTQANDIVANAISNNQVFWIIGDSDVKEFMRSILDDYGEKIDSRNLQELQELLRSVEESPES